VEIRHIETGYLAQVIQGSNLRLLFADTLSTSTPVPPKGMMHLQQQQQQQAMGIQQPYNGGGGGPYGQMQYYGHHGHHHHHPSQGYSSGPSRMPQPQIPSQISLQMLYGGRDEILVVSEDRVFALKPAAGSAVSGSQSLHTVLPDGGSINSSGGSSRTMALR